MELVETDGVVSATLRITRNELAILGIAMGQAGIRGYLREFPEASALALAMVELMIEAFPLDPEKPERNVS